MAESYEMLSTLYDVAVCDPFAEGAPEPGPKTGRVLVVARNGERSSQ